MPRPDRAEPARVPRARFVAVVAVLAGLLALIIPLCVDGMSAMPVGARSVLVASAAVQPSSMPMPSMNSDGCAGARGGVAECGFAVPHSAADSSMPGSGGLLLACIVFLIAVLVAALGLRRPAAGWVAVAPTAAARDRFVAWTPRRSTLAELCVLRT